MSNLLKIEADIERALTDFIREKLNSNTYNILFSLGFWVNSNDRDSNARTEIVVEGNKYELKTKKFVPMTIEGYDGNITALEGIFNAEYMVPLTFQINTECPVFMNDVINALNEFKNSLRGQIFRIPINVEGEPQYFSIVTSTDNVTPVGGLDVMSGENYAYAMLGVSFDISKDLSYGNQVEIYIGEIDSNKKVNHFSRVYPINPELERSNTPETFQNFNAGQVRNVIKETDFVFGGAFFVKEDDIHYSLLEDVVKKSKLNKPYLLNIKFNRFKGVELETAFELKETVVIIAGSASFTVGENIFMEIGFAKYIDDSYSFKVDFNTQNKNELRLNVLCELQDFTLQEDVITGENETTLNLVYDLYNFEIEDFLNPESVSLGATLQYTLEQTLEPSDENELAISLNYTLDKEETVPPSPEPNESQYYSNNYQNQSSVNISYDIIQTDSNFQFEEM